MGLCYPVHIPLNIHESCFILCVHNKHCLHSTTLTILMLYATVYPPFPVAGSTHQPVIIVAVLVRRIIVGEPKFLVKIGNTKKLCKIFCFSLCAYACTSQSKGNRSVQTCNLLLVKFHQYRLPLPPRSRDLVPALWFSLHFIYSNNPTPCRRSLPSLPPQKNLISLEA